MAGRPRSLGTEKVVNGATFSEFCEEQRIRILHRRFDRRPGETYEDLELRQVERNDFFSPYTLYRDALRTYKGSVYHAHGPRRGPS